MYNSHVPCVIAVIIPALFLFQWFSSYDEEGRVYFFEENSDESSWTLPDFSNAGCDVSTAEGMNNLLKQKFIFCHLFVCSV
jgi:Splicing factor